MKLFKYTILLYIINICISPKLLADESSLPNKTAKEYNTLGENYLKGQGVHINYIKAAEYFTKAADQGDANAQFNLGMMYFNGDGVLFNYKKSAEYLTKAANQGNIDAKQLKDIPKSTVSNNQEIYELSCPNNSQHTMQDMADCVHTMTKQLDVVTNKYIITIKSHIQRQYDNDPKLSKETLASFEQENKSWKKLIQEASSATYSYNEKGSMRGVVANARALELMEYRIHNQWRNWLVFTDTVSEYDPPEPIFKNTH
ncbi:unnamed protein product [Commensalibacter communis]|uniref:tetratricopeptide repeat protein n=1 Tax=Commensalibacter communis TaxID=2972786 RepID=UPI0022FFB571|nr:tetratricopeptide repeat protein [Commensalibacter communis]CAI3945139.1 unnamed protein product [Commensalibacter communis]